MTDELEIQNRISKATASFGRLRKRLWNSHAVTLNVKCQIYRAVVLSTLLYGTETWTIYVHQVRRLNSVMMRHLRSIMGLSLCDHIPNRVILEKAGLSDLDSTLCHKNLQWAGHVARMDNHRLPKQILFSQLSEGCRNVGRPRLRFKDVMRRNLRRQGVPCSSWYNQAQQRSSWRFAIKKSKSKTTDS